MAARAAGDRPRGQSSSGMWWKFMPNQTAISVGGRNTTAAIEKILVISFCSMLIRPSAASSRKFRLPDT